jgi:hypothetical protein
MALMMLFPSNREAQIVALTHVKRALLEASWLFLLRRPPVMCISDSISNTAPGNLGGKRFPVVNMLYRWRALSNPIRLTTSCRKMRSLCRPERFFAKAMIGPPYRGEWPRAAAICSLLGRIRSACSRFLGLAVGDRVIIYPSDRIVAEASVFARRRI